MLGVFAEVVVGLLPQDDAIPMMTMLSSPDKLHLIDGDADSVEAEFIMNELRAMRSTGRG